MKEKILRFLEITVPESVMFKMLDLIKQSFPMVKDMPEEIWEDYKSLYDNEELHRRLAPVYENYFTEEEIDFIISFLEDKKSEKYINLINSGYCYQEISDISEKYMNEIVSSILMKLEEGGYDVGM